MNPRVPTLRGALTRAGILEVDRGLALCEDPHLVDVLGPITAGSWLLTQLSHVPDADALLLGLTRLCGRVGEDQREYLRQLCRPASGEETAEDQGLTEARQRLWMLLGSSPALSEDLIAHPEQLELLAAAQDAVFADEDIVRAALLDSVGADPSAAVPVAPNGGALAVDRMRREYRRRLMQIAAWDLSQPDPVGIVPQITQALSHLAGGALEAGLAIARAQLPDYAKTRIAIMAFGKCGAQELNYVSDVDVIYVAEPGPGQDESEALRQATALATTAAGACSAASGEAPLWQVDAALRPEGNQGPLVRTLASHVAYYERWAVTWEFQALLKARFAAGDRGLGERYIAALNPLVWQAAERENFVEDARAMRRRVEDLIPGAHQDRQIKLGKGGLRDVEFTVQLIQMVHGRADTTIRRPATLDAIQDLSAGGYISRDDAKELDKCYRQLRVIEHRLQLYRLTRTHLLPKGELNLRRLARTSKLGTENIEELWRTIRHRVRDLHEELYYRPILPETARLSAQEAILAPDAAHARLAAIGFADPTGAMRHIEALTDGVSRTALIQRQLLPVMLGWFAGGADADAGLLAFRKLSDALGRSPWYLKLLRDSGQAAERLALVLSTSKYLSESLTRTPETVMWLADDAELLPPSADKLTTLVTSVISRDHELKAATARLRAIRVTEFARSAMAEFLGVATPGQVMRALSTVNDAVLQGGLDIAIRKVNAERGMAMGPTRLAIIAMGSLGAGESGYASDADVMVVHEPLPGADAEIATEYARDVVSTWRGLLSDPGAETPLPIDLDLRPEGKQGPIVRSLESYAQYYSRWSDPWEAQALLRARPVAGDPDLQARFMELVDPLRFPVQGLKDSDVREVRRIKARVEAERLPRGIEPRRHLKLGPGGISDVEWLTQMIQMRHAGSHPQLRLQSTLDVLTAAATLGFVADRDAEHLGEAWLLAVKIRHAIVIFTGRDAGPQLDVLPTNRRSLSGIAQILGYGQGQGQVLEDEWLRASRRSRVIFERLFYGEQAVNDYTS